MDPAHLRMLALAVESAVFQSLVNAQNDPERENHWRNHAEMLDKKFKTNYGRHYARILYG